jgi:hypothetical protein
VPGEILPVEQNVAAIYVVQSGSQRQESGLTSPVGTYKGDELARFSGHADPVQHPAEPYILEDQAPGPPMQRRWVARVGQQRWTREKSLYGLFADSRLVPVFMYSAEVSQLMCE